MVVQAQGTYWSINDDNYDAYEPRQYTIRILMTYDTTDTNT